MITDLHCHSNFSIDAEDGVGAMIDAAINAGLDIFAITDHADFAENDSCVEPDSYLAELSRHRPVKIKFLRGIEVGLQFEHRQNFQKFMRGREFDFVIGSMHRAQLEDFCDGTFYRNRSGEECWQIYLAETLKAIQSCSDFDSLGHLDILTRYHHLRGSDFPETMFEKLDQIFKWLIENGKGLEINTSFFHQFNRCHPQLSMLKRYRRLGGEIITIGSDAHNCKCVGRNIDKGIAAAKEAGFNRLAWFEKRKVRFAELP